MRMSEREMFIGLFTVPLLNLLPLNNRAHLLNCLVIRQNPYSLFVYQLTPLILLGGSPPVRQLMLLEYRLVSVWLNAWERIGFKILHVEDTLNRH